jgi:hypothetical protein
MTRQIATTALTGAAVLVLAGTVSAGVAAKPPTALILQKADFPAGTVYDADDSDLSGFKPRLEAGGVDYEAATATGLGSSSGKGSLNVVATVFVTPSVAQAKKAFALLRPPGGRLPFWITGGAPITGAAYGDEQVSRLKTAGTEGIWFARIVVRKRATVWALHVTSERRPPLAKNEVLAAFTTYARKLKTRIGNG